MSRWSSGLMCPVGKRGVAGSIPDGDIYLYFEFFACFPSSQYGGAHSNEIKHDHSHLVYVVLEVIIQGLCIYITAVQL